MFISSFMKSPEQPYAQEEGRASVSVESEKGLQSIVRTLKETAQRFHILLEEADALLAQGNAAGYKEKLQERARLLIELPNQLADLLEGKKGINDELKQQIRYDISAFSEVAQRALTAGRSGSFALGVLLQSRGGKGKNDLEELIESLEGK